MPQLMSMSQAQHPKAAGPGASATATTLRPPFNEMPRRAELIGIQTIVLHRCAVVLLVNAC
jgi:hypothetical protein